MKLQGKVSIVTGAARGIGLAIARRLAREGSSIVVADLDPQGCERVALELNEMGVDALSLAVDITGEEARAHMVKTALQVYGHVDILVNNAGIMNRVPLLDVTPEVWHRTMQVNLDAAFFCAQAVLPTMRDQQWGRIINITSMSARTGGQASPPHYAVSKTGMVGMTRSLARVVGAWGVTVNAIAPGIIDTDMIADWPPETTKWWLEQIPLHRLGTTEDVAAAAAFLASDDAAYITGTTLDVNGGYYMG
jgi:NAD(P)-dependent dehydrogenase (short-subunit alcohol dehydrogenase family)